MITLIEKFNNNWPSWVIPCIKRGRSGRCLTALDNVDIANVEVHTDYKSSYFRDPSKICFFLLKDRHNQDCVLIKSDGRIYRDSYGSWEFGQWTDLSKKSQKFIEEHMNDVCWIDLYETDNSEVHADSRDAMSKVARQNKGQAKTGYGEYARWTTPAGYDKSGYHLNPDKYINMLYKIDKDNYAQQLERMYKKLDDIIKYCAQIENNLGNQFGVNGMGRKNQTKFFRRFGYLQSRKEDVISAYKDLYSLIEECLRDDSFGAHNNQFARLIKSFICNVDRFKDTKEAMDEILKEQEEEASLGDEFFT